MEKNKEEEEETKQIMRRKNVLKGIVLNLSHSYTRS